MPTFGEGLGLGASSFLTGFLNAKAEQNRMRRVAEEERRAEMEREERREKVQRALQGEQFARERAATMEDIRSRIRTPEEQTFAEIGERPMAPPPQFSPMAQAAGLKQRASIPDTMGEREAKRIRMERAAQAMAQAREQRMGGYEEQAAMLRPQEMVAGIAQRQSAIKSPEMLQAELEAEQGLGTQRRASAELDRVRMQDIASGGGASGRLPQADEVGFAKDVVARGYITLDASDYKPMLDPLGRVVMDANGKPLQGAIDWDRVFVKVTSNPRGQNLWDEYRRRGTVSPVPPAPQQSDYPWERR